MLRINIENNELKDWFLDLGGVMAHKYQGQLFTGIVEEYYDNGVLFSEDEYLNGYLEGWKRYIMEMANHILSIKHIITYKFPIRIKNTVKMGLWLAGIKFHYVKYKNGCFEGLQGQL